MPPTPLPNLYPDRYRLFVGKRTNGETFDFSAGGERRGIVLHIDR